MNNKIMSLDLPVKEVYKKIWCPDNEVRFVKIAMLLCPVVSVLLEE